MFPLGYKFLPTDVELVGLYLKYKLTVGDFPGGYGFEKLFIDIDIYQYNPQDLIMKHSKLEDEQTEWYFFTSRSRRYQNGSRPDRTAGNGYWKATGKDKPVKDGGVLIGYARVLDFYVGKQPMGERTDWKMHEYLLKEQRDTHRNYSLKNRHDRHSPQLDKWVLCKIYKNKRGNKAADDDANQDDYDNSQQVDPPPLLPPMHNTRNMQYCQNTYYGYGCYGQSSRPPLGVIHGREINRSLPVQKNAGGHNDHGWNGNALPSSTSFNPPNHNQCMINGGSDCNSTMDVPNWETWIDNLKLLDVDYILGCSNPSDGAVDGAGEWHNIGEDMQKFADSLDDNALSDDRDCNAGGDDQNTPLTDVNLEDIEFIF